MSSIPTILALSSTASTQFLLLAQEAKILNGNFSTDFGHYETVRVQSTADNIAGIGASAMVVGKNNFHFGVAEVISTDAPDEFCLRDLIRSIYEIRDLEKSWKITVNTKRSFTNHGHIPNQCAVALIPYDQGFKGLLVFFHDDVVLGVYTFGRSAHTGMIRRGQTESSFPINLVDASVRVKKEELVEA